MSEPIVLAPRLDLSAAGGLLALLSENRDDEVTLDMTDVTYLGALCMQVMIAVAEDARKDGRTFQITNSSDRVIDQLRVMGMTPESIAEGRK